MTAPAGSGAGAFWREARQVLERVHEGSWARVVQAGEWVAESLSRGRRVLVFGTGHSHLLAEEFYARAGGLAEVEAILEPSLMLHEGPLKSSALERLPGLGGLLWRERAGHAGVGDTVFVFSNSGRNPVPVEFAQAARRAGARVVAVTSLAHTYSQAPVVDGMPRLAEVADLVVDNGGVPGDAAVAVPGLSLPVGATSTLAGSLIVQAIVCEAAWRMTELGHPPRILRSYNVEVR